MSAILHLIILKKGKRNIKNGPKMSLFAKNEHRLAILCKIISTFAR